MSTDDARWPAALVHIFTALGAVCGLMATLAIIAGAWESAFAWLGVALVVDGIDGTFARKVDVGRRLPRFSGDRLDLVIDYVTYVFAPALALLQAGYLPGYPGLLLAGCILVSSLFHFSDTQSKADDYSFVGFPAIWNAVAFYIFALGLSPQIAMALAVACVVLTFVPLKWAHPFRTAALRPVTLAVMVIWGVAAASTLLSGFPASGWALAALLVAAIYGVGLALFGGLSGAPRQSP
jgi:phosphatidylcholine synthase